MRTDPILPFWELLCALFNPEELRRLVYLRIDKEILPEGSLSLGAYAFEIALAMERRG